MYISCVRFFGTMGQKAQTTANKVDFNPKCRFFMCQVQFYGSVPISGTVTPLNLPQIQVI